MSATPPLTARARLEGRVISSGLAFGVARVEQPFSFATAPLTITAEEVEGELLRLRRATDLVREHLEEHVRGVHAPAQEDLEQIVAAHLLALDDAPFFESIEDRIRNQLLSANRAVNEAFTAAASRLAASSDCYMRARAEDFRDICLIIRRALVQGKDAFQDRGLGEEPTVLVVPHLRPSTVLRARREGAVGFVTSSTAFTSHGAILLRAAEIPALGGVVLEDSGIQDGTPLLVDAVRGELIVHPQEDDLTFARATIDAIRSPVENMDLPPVDAKLKGGGSVLLHANIDHPSQAALCLANRLHGVGLFRTELLVADSGTVPNEESQYQTIRNLADSIAGRPLVIRTFDFGAEKEPTGFYECQGQNPALGLRGVRRHIHRFPEELKTQLCAILRAAVASDISILVPMVTDAGDIQTVREYLSEVSADLTSRGVPFNPEVRLGAMLEIPAAALRVKELLEVVDFLSVGTNDLVQYLAAADRENPAVVDYQNVERSGLYEILELVMNVARRAGRENDISVCGELASDPRGACELVRLGVRSLSVTPHAANSVREALQALAVQREATIGTGLLLTPKH
jgi:phosphoenolpyruvate-protein phosphotransferase (PTS system enzyme I)